MSNLSSTVGAALRRVRLEARLSQAEVTDHLDLSPDFYAQVEAGHTSPGVVTLIRLAAFFDVSIDELLGLSPASEPDSRHQRATAADSPEIRRLIHQLRRASPSTLRIVTIVLSEIEGILAERDGRRNREQE